MTPQSHETIINDCYTDIMKRTASIQRLKMMTPEAIQATESINVYGGMIYISVNTREALHKVRPCFGANRTWSKDVLRDARMQYRVTDGPVMLTLTCGELPPTCKVVEEEVEIPAEPAKEARIEKRMRVICNEEAA